jgi:hypothetical protein
VSNAVRKSIAATILSSMRNSSNKSISSSRISYVKPSNLLLLCLLVYLLASSFLSYNALPALSSPPAAQPQSKIDASKVLIKDSHVRRGSIVDDATSSSQYQSKHQLEYSEQQQQQQQRDAATTSASNPSREKVKQNSVKQQQQQQLPDSPIQVIPATPIQTPIPPPLSAAVAVAQPQRRQRRALLYTMDSIDTYIAAAARGGPSGEITIRNSLTAALTSLSITIDIAHSDAELFEYGNKNNDNNDGGDLNDNYYDLFIFDAWTWAGPGWKPRPFVIGREDDVFILDFFGAPFPTKKGINVPPDRILTAFPVYPGNSYLGYYIDDTDSVLSIARKVKKKNQGVIWGKKPEYFKDRKDLLRDISSYVPLHSTATGGSALSSSSSSNIIFHGHSTPADWNALLAESKFMIGMGDPLAGPSAIDAIVNGAVYINPRYKHSVKDVYTSQHPYLEKSVGFPYVCTADLDKKWEVMKCVKEAVEREEDLPGLIPKELMKVEYMKRVKTIFAKYID